MEWLPIETAPKDREVLLYCEYAGVVIGSFCHDNFAKNPRPFWTHDKEKLFGVREVRKDQPSHWMPLPEDPS